MNSRTLANWCLACVALLLAASAAHAELVAATSFEGAEGYTPAGLDVRTYGGIGYPLSEPGDWEGNTWAGARGGDEYTGVLAGTAYTGTQFLFLQRPGTSSDTDIILRRKFPIQTGLLYYRFALGIDSNVQYTGPGTRYWEINKRLNLTVDRRISNTLDGTDGNIGTETFRMDLDRDGRIIISQSSFGSSITLTKNWDGTTSDGSAPITSALNSWVPVEVFMDIPSQRFWLFWDGTYLGSFPFRRNLTNNGGNREVNMLRFQLPRLDYPGRGERLRIDDIELRTDPPAAFDPCLTAVATGDVTITMVAGDPAPPPVEYTVFNYGSTSTSWSAVELDATLTPTDVPWLSLSTPGGSLDSMDSTPVTAIIDPVGLPGGTHIAYVKFADGCEPANEVTRQIRLNVTGCTWTLSSCNQVRAYLADYPEMVVPDVVYRVTNTGQQPMTYNVTASGSSCLSGMWTLTNASATVPPGQYVDVVATFDPAPLQGQGTDNSYTCNLLFTDDCSAQTFTRTIRLRYMGEGDTVVFRYPGDVDPLVDNSAGDGMRLGIYREDGLSHMGQVEDDPYASNGKVWRIEDGPGAKAKYRFMTNAGSPFEIANEIGATIVGRVKVRSQSGSRHGGLFLWEQDAGSCTYHWGGTDGLVQEIARGAAAVVPGSSDFVILRMTSIGRVDAPWDCSRIVRLYFNEDPTPVVELVGAAARTAQYEGLGFGAGSTDGSYDIAFDWVSGTNAGAFAPGEEEAVLGVSLVGRNCPADWADFDGDGDVDQVDFAYWQLCFTGPGDPAGQFDPQACRCADQDEDQDVDANDAAAFMECATGANVPFNVENPPPGCQ